MLMGTNEKGKGGDVVNQESKKTVKSCIICLWSFLLSITGGLMLGWWEYEYHPANRQLWMVPIGLILFLTPPFIWFAVFISESCNSKEDSARDSIIDADQKPLKAVTTV